MKTKILNWDVNIQWMLIVLSTLVVCLCLYNTYFIMLLLLVELICGIYQFTSSGINLALNHKSAGFRKLRQWHFWGYIVFMAIMEQFNKMGGMGNMCVDLVFMTALPQLIFYAYFILCRKELHYLQNREFFILR